MKLFEIGIARYTRDYGVVSILADTEEEAMRKARQLSLDEEAMECIWDDSQAESEIDLINIRQVKEL